MKQQVLNAEQQVWSNQRIDWLIDWSLTAISAQIGYIVHLKSMLQLKKW